MPEACLQLQLDCEDDIGWHEAEAEEVASEAGRAATCLCLPQRQEQTHTGYLCLLHLAQNNNKFDSQLAERPNPDRRARKLQTRWDKPLTGQLRLVPAELLSETKIRPLFAESLPP